MESEIHSRKPHIAIFPLCFGMGHLIPIAEFTKRLCTHHGFSVTLVISYWYCTSRQVTFIQRLASSSLDIRVIEIPHIEIVEDEENMKIETRLSKFVEKAKPHVEAVLDSLQHSASPISAFVIDFFCTALFDVAAKFHIPTHIFFAGPASVLCLMLHLPKLVSEIEVSFKDADFAVEIPGLPLIPARDMPTPIQDRSDSAFKWFVHHSSRFHEAAGILINTFAELEEDVVNALREGKVLSSSAAAMPSIYPVGPLISSKSDRPDDSECLKWLDQQPPSSVLFVSFGSGATLSVEQIAELALGLEASGHRFLWVVRGPHKYITFSPKQETSVSHLLPEGFESRTKDRGLVVPFWAPQVPVLSHPSTGGFFSHSGWNSTLESISHGVPIISWPFFAEQRLNRFLLVNQYKVAIEAKTETDGFLRREEAERVVRELMEGKEGARVREKMREMKEKAKIALAEGGSSYNALAAAASDFLQRRG
uniref:Glycosyltransferase n=1 Tax=Wollemia nobilis TaxID=56998 RepID=A0A0C9S6H0_9CONI